MHSRDVVCMDATSAGLILQGYIQLHECSQVQHHDHKCKPTTGVGL